MLRAILTVQSCTKPPILDRKKCKLEKKKKREKKFSLLHVGVRAVASLSFHATPYGKRCLRGTSLLPSLKQLCSSPHPGGCVSVAQPGLCIPASGRPPGLGEGVDTRGLAGGCLCHWQKRAGSLPLGQPLRRWGSFAGQVFGRRRVFLNAAQGDCQAAPAEQRERLQPARRSTRTAKPGKSPFGLKATVLGLQKPAGNRGDLVSRNRFGKVLCGGAKSECRCPAEGKRPCCPHGRARVDAGARFC